MDARNLIRLWLSIIHPSLSALCVDCIGIVRKNIRRCLPSICWPQNTSRPIPRGRLRLGNAYIKRGDLVAALAAYQHATELAPNESTYWRLLAVFCAENGVHLEDVGLPAAQKAVDLAPDDPSALDALGWAYLSSGRYANAEQILLDVIKRFPDHLPAHIHLAMTYLAQGNRAAAFDKLIYVQSADPNGADGEMAKQLLKQYFP